MGLFSDESAPRSWRNALRRNRGTFIVLAMLAVGFYGPIKVCFNAARAPGWPRGLAGLLANWRVVRWADPVAERRRPQVHQLVPSSAMQVADGAASLEEETAMDWSHHHQRVTTVNLAAPATTPARSHRHVPRLRLVVGVFTTADDEGKGWRDSARDSWLETLRYSPYAHDVVVHFLVGGCLTEEQRQQHLKEQSSNDTLYLARCAKAEVERPTKAELSTWLLRDWLRWVGERYDYAYALKVQHDVVVRLPLVLGALPLEPPPMFYWGRVVAARGDRPHTGSRWALQAGDEMQEHEASYYDAIDAQAEPLTQAEAEAEGEAAVAAEEAERESAVAAEEAERESAVAAEEAKRESAVAAEESLEAEVEVGAEVDTKIEMDAPATEQAEVSMPRETNLEAGGGAEHEATYYDAIDAQAEPLTQAEAEAEGEAEVAAEGANVADVEEVEQDAEEEMVEEAEEGMHLIVEEEMEERMDAATATIKVAAAQAEIDAIVEQVVQEAARLATAHMDPAFYVMSSSVARWVSTPPIPLLLPSSVTDESAGMADAIDTLVLRRQGWRDDLTISACSAAAHPCASTAWIVCKADTPVRLETVHQACENADGALWPIRRTPRKPRESSKRGEGAYTTNTVDVIVANPGTDENYHRAIYKAFKAQRGVPNKHMYVADSSAFGPSTFFSKLSDDAVTYLHMSGRSDTGARRNALIDKGHGSVIAHFDGAYYSPTYLANTVTFMNNSHADMVKLSAWYVYRRSLGVLHYLDNTAGYYGGLKRCGLGSDESQPTHRLSHGFSYAYMRHVWHKKSIMPGGAHRFQEARIGKASPGSDETICFNFASLLQQRGKTIADRKDTEGLALQIVDHHAGASESSNAKRLNAQFHLPPFVLLSKFPALKSNGWWDWVTDKKAATRKHMYF